MIKSALLNSHFSPNRYSLKQILSQTDGQQRKQRGAKNTQSHSLFGRLSRAAVRLLAVDSHLSSETNLAGRPNAETTMGQRLSVGWRSCGWHALQAAFSHCGALLVRAWKQNIKPLVREWFYTTPD